MKYTFRKYEFTDAASAQSAIDALGVDEETNTPTHRHTIAMLGHIVTTAATYDEEGEELTAAVLADNYSVDVLWRCLLYTSPSPRDRTRSRMPSSA